MFSYEGPLPALPDIFKRDARAPSPEYVNRVHRIGHPCVLFGWMSRMRWQLRSQPGDVLLRIFTEGHHWHGRVAAGLLQAGVRYVRQEEPMHWPELQLSGHMDGLVEDGPAVPQLPRGESAVVDVKGMSDFAFAAINSVDDLQNSSHWYHRAYLVQPSLYASHPDVNAEWCCLYKVKRSTAEVGQIWWRTEDAAMEIATAKAACRRINGAIDNPMTEPDGAHIPPVDLATPGDWCDDCDFASICPAYQIKGVGIQMASAEVRELVERLHELQAGKREYDGVAKQLMAMWKTAGAGTYACGDFMAVVKEVPEAVVPAKPETVRKSYLRTTYKTRSQDND